MLILGDLNIVEVFTPLDTLLNGHIVNQFTYGEDSAPDWDETPIVDVHPLHNVGGPDRIPATTTLTICRLLPIFDWPLRHPLILTAVERWTAATLLNFRRSLRWDPRTCDST